MSEDSKEFVGFALPEGRSDSRDAKMKLFEMREGSGVCR